MTPSRTDLVREHKYLVVRIARSFARRARWLSPGDLESWGLEGLATAAQAFDEAREIPFEVFASMKIRWAVLEGYRREKGARRRANLAEQTWSARPGIVQAQTCVTLTGDPAEHLASTEEDIARRDDELARAALVRELCGRLPAREAEVIRAHYFEDQELRAIADASGSKYTTICRRHRAALARLSTQIRRAALPASTRFGGREEILSAFVTAGGAP